MEISNRISEESIEKITKSDSNFAATFVNHYLLQDNNFNGHCPIKNNISIPEKVKHWYISCTLRPKLRNSNTNFTLSSCLFESVKLTKSADTDKCKYTGYGIGFDSRSEFLFTNGIYGKNVIIFVADMSSSLYVENKSKVTLILLERLTQRSNDMALTAEAKCSINFQ